MLGVSVGWMEWVGREGLGWKLCCEWTDDMLGEVKSSGAILVTRICSLLFFHVAHSLLFKYRSSLSWFAYSRLLAVCWTLLNPGLAAGFWGLLIAAYGVIQRQCLTKAELSV